MVLPRDKQNMRANKGSVFTSGLSKTIKTTLTNWAAWLNNRDVPLLVSGIGMAIMLIWAGSYKMTVPGAEGIIPLVSNSPLISWHFKVFGPYIGADIIGATEIVAALLIVTGYFKPHAGMVGGSIASLMFFITSSMFITTRHHQRRSRDEIHESPRPFSSSRMSSPLACPST